MWLFGVVMPGKGPPCACSEAHQRAEIGFEVGVGDVRVGAALDRVGDIGGGDFAVDRWAEVHARADVDGDRLAIGGDFGRAGGHVRGNFAQLVGLVGVERALGRVDRLVVDRGVGLAGIEVFEVRMVEDRQRAAAHAPGLGLAQRGLNPGCRLDAARFRDRAGARAARGERQRGEQQRTPDERDRCELPDDPPSNEITTDTPPVCRLKSPASRASPGPPPARASCPRRWA